MPGISGMAFATTMFPYVASPWRSEHSPLIGLPFVSYIIASNHSSKHFVSRARLSECSQRGETLYWWAP